MPEEDRQWRRRIEQMVRAAAANTSSGGGDGGPHTHPESEVSGLASDLAGKATTGHTHAAQAPSAHTHPESEVTNLVSDLAGKAATHSHPYEPSGAVATHAAAVDPHPTYLTAAEGNAAYATAGHTHAAGAVAVQKATADQPSTSVALADATNMGFAIAALGNYEFEYLLAITSAATATGWQFGFTGPASPTMFVVVCEYQSSATAWTTVTLTALGNFPLVTAAYAANTPIVVRIKGVLANGSNAGTLQLRFATEVANSAITIKRGSTLIVA